MCIFVCRRLCVSTVFPKYINQPVAQAIVAHTFIAWFYICLNLSQKLSPVSAHVCRIPDDSHLALAPPVLRSSCSISPCTASSRIDLRPPTVSQVSLLSNVKQCLFPPAEQSSNDLFYLTSLLAKPRGWTRRLRGKTNLYLKSGSLSPVSVLLGQSFAFSRLYLHLRLRHDHTCLCSRGNACCPESSGVPKGILTAKNFV